MQFTGLVMQPQELAAVKDIFDEIVAEPWFDNADGSEGALAAFMLRTYREGVTDRDRLRTYCREVARFRWGNPELDQG